MRGNGDVEMGAESDAVIDKMHNILQLCHQGYSNTISECHVYIRTPTDVSPHVCVTVLPPGAKKSPSIEGFTKPLRSAITVSSRYQNPPTWCRNDYCFPILSCQPQTR